MTLTWMRKIFYSLGGVTVLLRSSPCFGSLLEVVRPIETKATDVNTTIVWVFWTCVGAALAYRIFHIAFRNPNDREKHMTAIAWIVGGAILIASIGKLIAWMKSGV